MGRKRFAAIAAAIVVGMGAPPAGAAVPDLERDVGDASSPRCSTAGSSPASSSPRPTSTASPRSTSAGRRSTPSARSTRTRSRRRGSPTSRAAPTASAGRSRACRCCSRTTSTSPGCRRRRLDRARALGARHATRRRPAAEGRGRGDPRQGQPDRVRRLGLQQPAAATARCSGQVLNPYDLRATPAARARLGVAAAAGLAALTIGSTARARSSRPRPRTASSASGPRPACGAATASCRSPSGRTRSARWCRPSATRRCC